MYKVVACHVKLYDWQVWGFILKVWINCTRGITHDG